MDDGTADGGDGLSRAGRILLVVLGVQVAVLLVTGVALYFFYRPSVGQFWSDLATGSDRWDVRLSQWLRFVHRFTSWLAVWTAVATGVVLALGSGGRLRRWPGAAVGAGIAVTTVAASLTGYLLPWDQLALWAVTVGSDLRGYKVLFEPAVKFVIVGGVELDRGTVIRWFLVHALGLGPALAVLVALGWRRTGVSPRPREGTRARTPGR